MMEYSSYHQNNLCEITNALILVIKCQGVYTKGSMDITLRQFRVDQMNKTFYLLIFKKIQNIQYISQFRKVFQEIRYLINKERQQNNKDTVKYLQQKLNKIIRFFNISVAKQNQICQMYLSKQNHYPKANILFCVKLDSQNKEKENLQYQLIHKSRINY